MSWSDEKWMLHQVNASRKEGEEEVTFENAKKANIPSSVRLGLEKSYGKGKVAKIFGEASQLQKAEMMFLEIEKGEITKEKKYSNIIGIAYAIANACGKLDSNHSLWDKYSDLSYYIPIKIMEREENDSWYFLILDFHEQELYISAEDLVKVRTWLFLSEETKENSPKKVFFDYIFELVYLSLKEIFEEVKAEIMGE